MRTHTLLLSAASIARLYAAAYGDQLAYLLRHARNVGVATMTCPATGCALYLTHTRVLGRTFYRVRVGGYSWDGRDVRQFMSLAGR